MFFYLLKIDNHLKYIYFKSNKKYNGLFNALHELSIFELTRAFFPYPILDKNSSYNFHKRVLIYAILFIISVIGIFISTIIYMKIC